LSGLRSAVSTKPLDTNKCSCKVRRVSTESSYLYAVQAAFRGGPLNGKWRDVPGWANEVEVTQRGRTGLYLREHLGPTGKFIWNGWQHDNREVVVSFVHPTKWIPESGLRLSLADLERPGDRDLSLLDQVAREVRKRNDPRIKSETLKQTNGEPWMTVVAWFNVEVRDQ